MAICPDCNRDMLNSDGCTVTVFTDYVGKGPIPRLKYGEEGSDWGADSGRRCHDCNCKPNEYHHPGCDVERCPVCKGQAISCDCELEGQEEEDEEVY